MKTSRPEIGLDYKEIMLLSSKSVNRNISLVTSFLSLIIGYIKQTSSMIFVSKIIILIFFFRTGITWNDETYWTIQMVDIFD